MGMVICARQAVLNINNFPRVFLVVCVVLTLGLVLTFCCLDYLIFYICFERTLIPTMILILG